jgi:hypothetical protein
MAPALVATLAPLAIQAVKSGVQYAKAKKIEKEYTDPGYKIPESSKRALSVAKYRASIENPGMEKGKEMLDRNLASSVSSIKRFTDSPSKALAAVVGASENKNTGLNDLAIRTAAFREKSLMGLETANNTMAIQENNVNQWDRDKYLQAKAAESALREASFQNMMNTAFGVSSVYAKQLNDMALESDDPKIRGTAYKANNRDSGTTTPFAEGVKMPPKKGTLSQQDGGYYRELGQPINL